MLRFLRKYNKMLLVVAGSVLMVLFLLPQAITQFGPNARNQVVFSIRGKTYHGRDLESAQAKLYAMQALEQTAGFPLFPFKFDSIEHWMLLVREAQIHGLVASGDQGDLLIQNIADVRAQQASAIGADQSQLAEMRANIRARVYSDLRTVLDDQRARIGDDRLRQAVAEVFGVKRLLELYGGFATISEPEAASIAVKHLDTAVADLGLVDYTECLAEAGEPTAEQLQEHFDKYKDVIPGSTPEGIGYRQPPRVKLEVVEVDLTRIRSAMTLDDIEVNKRWRQKQDVYGDNFAVARQRVESDLLDERLASVVHSLEEVGRRTLFRETSGLETDDGVYKKLPDDWVDKRVPMEKLAEDLNAEISKTVSLPSPTATVTRIVGWETSQDIASRAMGRAYMPIRGQSISLPGVVMLVRELSPEARSGLQVGVAFGPLMIPREKMVFARVLDARPAGPPESIDDVKAAATADWKKLRAFEIVQERIGEIRKTVVNSGSIDTLISAYQHSRVQMGVDVSRSNAALPSSNAPATVANTQTMRDSIMDRVAEWNPLTPVTDQSMDARVVTTPLPSEFGVGVALIQGRYPVTAEQMRTNLAALSNQYTSELYTLERSDPPFTFDRLKERLGYTLPESRKKNADDDADTEDADANG